MMEPVAKRLGIQSYTHKTDAFVQARERRAIIDAMVDRHVGEGLKEGDVVTCTHGKGTLVKYDSTTGECAVELDIDGHKHVISYESTGRTAREDRTKKGRGGGRVSHILPSFRPPPRARRVTALSDETRSLVILRTLAVR